MIQNLHCLITKLTTALQEIDTEHYLI